jgi:hypothetical protein
VVGERIATLGADEGITQRVGTDRAKPTLQADEAPEGKRDRDEGPQEHSVDESVQEEAAPDYAQGKTVWTVLEGFNLDSIEGL